MNQKKRTLILHVGVHRTATTSIQAFLHVNAEKLRHQGFLHPFGVPRHRDLINKIFSGEVDIDDLATQLSERASRWPQKIENIILSDEDISMRRDLSRLGRLQRYFNVVVVAGLRRQDLWLESWYFQNIKWQWQPSYSHVTFDGFLERRSDFHWVHYDRFIGHLEQVFGPENLRLFTFERAAMPAGPVEKFCDLIGLPTKGMKQPEQINSSRLPEMAELVRLLPLDRAKPRLRRVISQACERVDQRLQEKSGRRGGGLLLTSEARRRVLDEYASGNRLIAQRYFDRTELFRDPLPATDAPLAELRLPESHALVKEVIAPIFAELIDSLEPRTLPQEKRGGEG